MLFRQYSLKDVLGQLKLDLIGKDSQRGVSFTYSWLANQFGHFSLGFIPTLLVFSIFESSINESIYAAIWVTCFWFLFELYNFLGPLLLDRKSGSKLMYIPAAKTYHFRPEWSNVAFDTFTDILFFALGAFSAAQMIQASTKLLVIILVLLGVLIFPVLFWFTVKMSLQDASYPFQFRLSQWDRQITDENKDRVSEFLSESSGGPSHLFIFGPGNSGKSSLGVGVATEHSNRHICCQYLTGMKLYPMFSLDDETLRAHQKSRWTWRDCSLLLIDDINPGDPVDDLVTAQGFFEMLIKNPETGSENIDAIKSKKVIWITGINSPKESRFASWVSMLVAMGVSPSKIVTVNLG